MWAAKASRHAPEPMTPAVGIPTATADAIQGDVPTEVRTPCVASDSK